jgi:DNA-directed RNA polymerase subunit RPC12/RpoP
MLRCPECKSNRLRRSRSRNRWERWRRHVTGKAMFRCPDCGWRAAALDRMVSVAAASAPPTIPEPANLMGSPLARTLRLGAALEERGRMV